MGSPALNLYQAQHSPLHRLDPRVKVVLTVLIIVSNILLPDGAWLGLILTWTFLLLSAQLSRVGIGFLLSRSLIVLPFALAAATILISTPGDPLWELPRLQVTITTAGLIRFSTIMLRSWISVQAAILLSATTPFPDLIHALRHLKMPSVLVSTISFMYRYLFVLIGEARRLLRARTSRSAAGPDGGRKKSLSWSARTAGSMVGQLFLRSVERSERIYQAMQVRGYRGQLLTLNPHRMKPRDWMILLSVTVFLLLVQVLTYFSMA